MNIFVNNKEYHSPSPILTMAQLADELNIGQTEASVAVNDKRVSKSQWHTTFLTDGDVVTIITDESRY